jgi:hypothetical protein
VLARRDFGSDSPLYPNYYRHGNPRKEKWDKGSAASHLDGIVERVQFEQRIC